MGVNWQPVIDEALSAVNEGRVFQRKWRTILKLVGRKQSNYHERKGLEQALADAGIAVAPHLDGKGPKHDDFVTMIDASRAPDPSNVRFKLEDPLEDLIKAAMPSYPGLKGVEFVGRQVTIETGAGSSKLDLLGRKQLDRGRTRWYVIEVEVSNIKESIAQVLEYGRNFRTYGAKGSTIGAGTSVKTVTMSEGDELTLVVIAQDGGSDQARLLREAAIGEGFHSKWIVNQVHAEVVEP